MAVDEFGNLDDDPRRIATKWPSELVIVRHGQSERNIAKDKAQALGLKVSYANAVRDQDTPLTTLGMGQALHVGVELRADAPFDVAFVSPYLRTRQTLDQILKGMGQSPKIVYDERLREIEFGIMDGLTRDGFEAKYHEEMLRRQKEGKYWYRPPGGESRPDVALRLQSFLVTLSRDYVNHKALVVTHSVVVLMFRKLLERWTEEDYLQVDRNDDVKNCSITRYSTSSPRTAHFNKLLLDSYNSIVYPEGA